MSEDLPNMFMVRVDESFAAWSRMDHFHNTQEDAPAEPSVVAGGVLVGNTALVDAIKHVLDVTDPNPITDVVVEHPGVKYTFTEGRDTPADVAAAMIYVGAGRALLDGNGREHLDAVLDSEDDSPREDDAEIIF